MPIRKAEAEWFGKVTDGKGHMKLGSGAFDGPYSFQSRMQDGAGTNPEELIGAAHAGCFSMALSAVLTQAGLTATRIHTKAGVHLEKSGDAWGIPKIDLETEGEVPGIDQAKFQEYAETAKKNCPVSKLYTGAEITLKATLVS
ncbi:MAG: osmC [Bryobacterales bacterium]|nr:osmC [Bryobacterales bacterium]